MTGFVKKARPYLLGPRYEGPHVFIVYTGVAIVRETNEWICDRILIFYFTIFLPPGACTYSPKTTVATLLHLELSRYRC